VTFPADPSRARALVDQLARGDRSTALALHALISAADASGNADFDAAVKPYRELVQKLQSRTTGQVDSVAVEYTHHAQPGQGGPPPPGASELSEFASRTDTVMVVATSISENAGSDKPQTVRWTLRLDVSDIDGKLMISRLEPIR
jgi:hypothetical protein